MRRILSDPGWRPGRHWPGPRQRAGGRELGDLAHRVHLVRRHRHIAAARRYAGYASWLLVVLLAGAGAILEVVAVWSSR